MRRMQGEFPLAAMCRVLQVPRSSAAYTSERRPVKDLERLKVLVRHYLVTFRGFGVKRMYHLLKLSGVRASRAEVGRAYRELGILRRPSRRRARTTDSDHPFARYPNLVKGLQIERPGHVWVSDVTFVRIGDRFSYLALLMDVFTRRILGWGLSWFNDSALTLFALRTALQGEAAPEIHHSDQGSTYAAEDYVKILKARGTRISMSGAGKPHENGYAERLNRTVKEEEVLPGLYPGIEQARKAIGDFVAKYNTLRIHSSLAYRTPSEMFQEWCRDNA